MTDPVRAQVALCRARDAPDAEARLRALVDAWRCHRLVAIADLVDRAAELVSSRVMSIAEPTDHAWNEIAATDDALDRGWLLATLGAGNTGLARVQRLIQLAPDPRDAPTLAHLAFVVPQETERQHRLWRTSVMRVLEERGDARLLAFLPTDNRGHAFAAGVLGQRVETLRGKLTKYVSPSPTPDELPMLHDLGRHIEAERASTGANAVDTFLRDIWADPSDDGVREVFADWLQLRNDPRGEFIALQLAAARDGTVSDAARQREAELLRLHARRWMGPIEPAVAREPSRAALPDRGAAGAAGAAGAITHDFVRFRRGFLHGCAVDWRRIASRPALAVHPAWSTVREFTLSPLGDRACQSWLEHMAALGAQRIG